MAADRSGYHRPVLARSKRYPKTKLWFLAFYTTFAAAGSVAMGNFLWGDLQGGNATATVVHVYSQTTYTISFITEDGTRCQTRHKWLARNEPIKVLDKFEVHYSKFLPCDNVERADDLFSRFGGLLISPVLMIVGLAAPILVKRQARSEPA
jgi:hypothetical protein